MMWQSALLLLILPIASRFMPNTANKGLYLGSISALLNCLWFWIIQPANISTDTWLSSTLLLLTAGMGLDYVQAMRNVHQPQVSQLQDELQKAQMQLQAFKVALPDRAFIFDAKGYYVDVISGFISPEQQQYLMGKHVTETPETLQPETASQVLETIQQTISTGESQQLEYQAFTSKDKTWCWLEGRTALLHDPASTQPHVIWVARDISQQKQLQADSNKVQQLAQIGTWETDVQNDYVTWSDEMYHIFGIAPDEFEHTVEHSIAHIHPDDLEAFRAKIKNGQNPYPTEYRVVRPDGTIRTVYAVGDAMYDEQGQITKRIGLAQDITQRKQAEQEHIQLQIEQQRTSTLRNLISNVTHDIMTPLTIMKTSTYILGKTTDEAKRDEHLEKVKFHLQMVQKLFENLIMVSYLNNIRLDDLAPATSNIVSLLHNLVQQYRSLMREKNQTLVHDLPDQSVMLRLDAEYMFRAIANILHNAMQYTPEGGEVRLSLTKHDHDLCIAIGDNGIGIDPGEQKRIFDSFYRVAEYRPADGSSGLGLYVSKLVVELHGGKINVESTPTIGSTFNITLPLG